MSKIDTLIQELQLKKKKIDYLTYVLDLVQNDQKCIDFVEVQEDVFGKLKPILLKMQEDIENNVETTMDSLFSKDQVEALKLLAEKVKTKQNAPVKPAQVNKIHNDDAPVNKNLVPQQDKMNFAMDNRHLANKNVTVINNENLDVTGKVVGLEAPYVIVKTKQGPTIKVPLENIREA